MSRRPPIRAEIRPASLPEPSHRSTSSRRTGAVVPTSCRRLQLAVHRPDRHPQIANPAYRDPCRRRHRRRVFSVLADLAFPAGAPVLRRSRSRLRRCLQATPDPGRTAPTRRRRSSPGGVAAATPGRRGCLLAYKERGRRDLAGRLAVALAAAIGELGGGADLARARPIRGRRGPSPRRPARPAAGAGAARILRRGVSPPGRACPGTDRRPTGHRGTHRGRARSRGRKFVARTVGSGPCGRPRW